MKNIYMLQTNIRYPNGTYLPYAAGAIAAYSLADPEIGNNYELKEIFCMRETPQSIMDAVEAPAVFSFSCYVWNTEFNKEVARLVKQKYPDCLIIFGGHNIPENSTSFLDENAFVDFLIFGEGEKPFRDILLWAEGKKELCNVPNIAFRENGGTRLTGRSVEPDLSSYPSPYDMGLFDGILQKYPDVDFSAILETNRGCPYHCAFCDWCEQGSKIRCFNWSRIENDLLWMADKKIEFCYCADANFGILRQDEALIDFVVAVKEKTGYPKKFKVNFAKRNNETVFRITKKLEEAGLNKGATISFQSMTPDTLKSIGRENMPITYFSQLMELYRDAGISTYTEIILGLPDESYNDFCTGIGRLLASGQHTTLFIYNCELIVNSTMATDDFIQKYGIKSVETDLYVRHNELFDDGIREHSRCVIGTNKMDTDDWIRANLFSVLIQSCHSMGLLRFFALYLFDRQGVAYEDFYKALQLYAESRPDTVLGGCYAEFQQRFRDITLGTGAWSYNVPETNGVLWPYEEAFYIKLLLHVEAFYKEISDFLRAYRIDDALFGDLMAYQKAIVKVPGKRSVRLQLKYDLVPYFSDLMGRKKALLEQRRNRLLFRDGTLPDSPEAFAKECIWYGRSLQKNLFSDISLEYEDEA